MEHKILYALREIKNWQVAGCPGDGQFDARHGICPNIRDAMYRTNGVYTSATEVGEWLRPAFETWSEYTGTSVFPIPAKRGLKEGINAEMAYYAHTTEGDQWVGEYGDLRIELLDHCLAHFEAECAK